MAEGGSQQRKPDFKTAVKDVKAIATVLAMEAEAILGRRTARVLGILVLFAVVVGVLLALLNLYIAPSGAAQKKDVVATLAQILGGAALLSGLYFTWRTLQVNREGQITERFTRAIDQLGATDEKQNKRIEIRLGGIYALERIAWDSFAMENSPGRDYSTVMEVLAAYVRENTRQTPGLSRRSSGEASTATSFDVEAEQRAEEPTLTESHRPTADIQAILNVLGRTQARVPEEYHTRLDLHEANLQRANLLGAYLEGANLRGAILQGANLRGAILQRANLQKTNLRGANLQGAYFQKANLQEANLQGANLRGAKVTDEQLADTLSLQGATMPDGSKRP